MYGVLTLRCVVYDMRIDKATPNDWCVDKFQSQTVCRYFDIIPLLRIECRS